MGAGGRRGARCVTQGDTLEEAIALAKDAIAVYIADLEKHGEPILEEQDHPQAVVVDVGEVVA